MKKFGRLAALLSMLLTVSLILSACGGDNSTATPAPTAASGAGAAPTSANSPVAQGKTVIVEEQDFQFSPKDITINVGDTINFVNKGGAAHTAQASDGSFDSGSTEVGGSYSHTFTTLGKVAYYCKFHGTAAGKGMAGTITVTAANASSTGGTNATPTTAAAAGQGATVTVNVEDFQFTPKDITINVGGTINFVNKGAVAHTAQASDGSFDSGNLDAGQSFSQKFSQPGKIIYYCKYHGAASGSGMAGTITVVQGASAGSSGAASPTTMANMTPTVAMSMTATKVMTGGFMTGAPDSVAAADQPAGSTVIVKHIHANQNSFIAIHANTADNKPGSQLGHTAVKEGDNDNVMVQVSPATKAGDKVWPMLHIDAGIIGTYEFPGPDAPVIINSNIVMQQITITTVPMTVEELDNHFSATDITINAGDTIMFVNKGARTHTATAASGSWDSGDMAAGATFSHTFTTPGVFTIYCKYHGSADGKGMATAITVVAGTPTP